MREMVVQLVDMCEAEGRDCEEEVFVLFLFGYSWLENELGY